MITVTNVTLPAQVGCRHIHITYENEDLSVSTVGYHITDFNDPDALAINREDTIFDTIATFVEGTYDLTTVTREEIEALINGETI